jgi:hypothetical protein
MNVIREPVIRPCDIRQVGRAGFNPAPTFARQSNVKGAHIGAPLRIGADYLKRICGLRHQLLIDLCQFFRRLEVVFAVIL